MGDGSDEHCVHGQGQVHCTPQASDLIEKSVPPIETQAHAPQQEREGDHQLAGNHANESIERVLQSLHNVRVWAAHTHRKSAESARARWERGTAGTRQT